MRPISCPAFHLGSMLVLCRTKEHRAHGHPSINAVPEGTQQPTTELMNIDPADTPCINDVPLTTVDPTHPFQTPPN